MTSLIALCIGGFTAYVWLMTSWHIYVELRTRQPSAPRLRVLIFAAIGPPIIVAADLWSRMRRLWRSTDS